jgi:hypothetical protein
VWDVRGLTLTDLELDVLGFIHDIGPLSLQADFARANAVAIATLASFGHISNISPEGTPTRQWRLTLRGLGQLS